MHTVTAVIATHNRAAELSTTLRRLRTANAGAPVIVVDNASSDATSYVTACANAVAPQSVRLVRLPANQGAAARNVGARLARTPYIAFCDDDSWWAPGALARAGELLARHQGVGLLAGAICDVNGRPDPVVAQMVNSPLGSRDGLPGPSILGFVACGAVVRRDAFLESGGFSELLHIYGEENLLAYDMAANGWSLCCAAELVAYHRPSPLRGVPVQRRRRELRNALLVTAMRRPARRWPAMVANAVYSCLRQPALAGALPETLRLLPAALRQRRVLPRQIERQVRTLESLRSIPGGLDVAAEPGRA